MVAGHLSLCTVSSAIILPDLPNLLFDSPSVTLLPDSSAPQTFAISSAVLLPLIPETFTQPSLIFVWPTWVPPLLLIAITRAAEVHVYVQCSLSRSRAHRREWC